MFFGDKVIASLNWAVENIPDTGDVGILNPLESDQVRSWIKHFYTKYYSDSNQRIGLFGINPGRLGAGQTGIPFTDPINLEEVLGITNELPKRPELSSQFIFELMEEWGGLSKFFSQFYISSVCPLGFIKQGKNFNYYDEISLYKTLRPYIIDFLTSQLELGLNTKVAFSLGKGKNLKILKELNSENKWFDEVRPLPHPRWIMQYRRKNKAMHIENIISELSRVDI